MADIDPADLKVRSKLADLYMRDGNSAKAVEEHVAIADELHQEGPPGRGPAGPREGPQDRRQERRAARRAGPDPPRPEELREGGPVLEEAIRQAPERRPGPAHAWARPTSGPRRSRRPRRSSSASSSSTRATRRAASRWARVYLLQGPASTRPSTSSCPWSTGCWSARRARRRRRSCSRSSSRTPATSRAWSSWSRSTGCCEGQRGRRRPTRSSPRPTSTRARSSRPPACSRSWSTWSPRTSSTGPSSSSCASKSGGARRGAAARPADRPERRPGS